MEWKIFREHQPELGRSVIVWRSNHKHLKYTIAKLENNGSGKMIWRSFSNNQLKIEEDDWWYEFPLLTITQTYE
jgi:hypothetical protein